MSFVAAVLFLALSAPAVVTCEGRYDGHLQGITSDSAGDIFWSFTADLVKTDEEGKILKHVEVPFHHGDPCHADGLIYVPVNLGKPDKDAGDLNPWIYAYHAEDLTLAWRKPIPEVAHSAGGMDIRDGHFFIVGGLPPNQELNDVYEYDEKIRFVARHEINDSKTFLGIQTACFAQGAWWFGCYGTPRTLLKTDPNFKLLARTSFDCTLGIMPGPDGTMRVARSVPSKDGKHGAEIVSAKPTEEGGLEYSDE